VPTHEEILALPTPRLLAYYQKYRGYEWDGYPDEELLDYQIARRDWMKKLRVELSKRNHVPRK